MREDLLEKIIDIEGGFVNNPKDKGGPTKYGITIKTLSNYLGYNASVEDVKNLDKKTAKNIFIKLYYKTPKIDKLPNDKLQYLILDMSINHGPKNAIRILQNSCNKTQLLKYDLETDGIIGPNTIKASKLCLTYMGYYFINLICDERDIFYRKIVINNRSQSIFLKGWLKRSNLFRIKLPII